jgi:homoserine O-succinyltransferase/O-acetyltransferase
MGPPSVGVTERKRQRVAREPIVVGLVNNMPDGALEATEHQFAELLSAAEEQVGVSVRLRILSIPEVPRGERGRAYVSERTEDIGAVRETRLDGLIVTGLEPRAPKLVDEPYWLALAELIDWARDRTSSAIWSCLAAHAAVYHLDEVARQPFGEKLLGLFECTRASDHAIVAGMPARWCIPHSRYNDLPERALADAGYRLLSRSPQAGADLFMKQAGSLFLFFQGHPEYDPDALLREYRRDVGRFLRAEREDYPAMPRDYFDVATAAALAAFEQRALRNRDPEMLAELPADGASFEPLHPWHSTAVLLYTNWLRYLVAHRAAARPSALEAHS